MSTTKATVTAAIRSELTVTGMTCGNCVRHVEEALAEIPGVNGVVDLAAGTATVDHPSSVSVLDLTDAIADAGYRAAVRPA